MFSISDCNTDNTTETSRKYCNIGDRDPALNTKYSTDLSKVVTKCHIRKEPTVQGV